MFEMKAGGRIEDRNKLPPGRDRKQRASNTACINTLNRSF
jgi:hypothetical protein